MQTSVTTTTSTSVGFTSVESTVTEFPFAQSPSPFSSDTGGFDGNSFVFAQSPSPDDTFVSSQLSVETGSSSDSKSDSKSDSNSSSNTPVESTSVDGIVADCNACTSYITMVDEMFKSVEIEISFEETVTTVSSSGRRLQLHEEPVVAELKENLHLYGRKDQDILRGCMGLLGN